MDSRIKKAIWAITPRYLRGFIEDRINFRFRSSQQLWAAQKIFSWWIRQRYPQLTRTEHIPSPRLTDQEFKVYSQNGEDGVLTFIFSRIGVANYSLVEFGIEDGTECNSANLLLNFGWQGLLMEANPAKATRAKNFFRQHLREQCANVRVIECVVTAENINDVLRAQAITGEIDLLSIDIDSTDYWVWKAITVISPRVVVIEYNAALGRERSVTVVYQPNFDFSHFTENYFGASLAALTKLADSKGYILVGCDSHGVNAFFVRKDLAQGKLHQVSVAEAYYPHWFTMTSPTKNVEDYFQSIQHLGFVQV